MKPGYQYEALAPLECCQYKDLNRVTAINTDMGSIAYEAQTRNVEAPFCFDGEDLELIP